MRSFLLLTSLFFTVFTGYAQGDVSERWCRAGFFTSENGNFGTGIVKGNTGSRAYFYRDGSEKDNCPDGDSCRERSYLVAGDRVVVNGIRGKSACVWYTPAKGLPTIGWMRAADLDLPAARAAVRVSDWLGTWKYAENTISITENKLAGWLNIGGEAYWKGLGDNIHIGQLDGRAEPENGVLRYSDGDDEFDCKVTMRVVGEFLVVSDNLHCGGMNVSFSGVYKRAPERKGVRPRK